MPRVISSILRATSAITHRVLGGAVRADHLVQSAPSPQNSLDIFSGQWASKFPAPLGTATTGVSELFEDERIKWMIQQLGGVGGRTVLELGPLEAGHSYMLERAGAAEVTAVEANTTAYLKCLVVKELYGLNRCRFLCGDFVEYLKHCGRRFDVCLACGILYHMTDPLEVLELISRTTDSVFVWTHYFDAAVVGRTNSLAGRFSRTVETTHAGHRYNLHRLEYGLSRGRGRFWGGVRSHARWMERADLMAALTRLGYTELRVAFDEPGHQNGPAIAVLATRDPAGKSGG